MLYAPFDTCKCFYAHSLSSLIPEQIESMLSSQTPLSGMRTLRVASEPSSPRWTRFYVIAYASRKLQKYEKNYTPFLLEMQAAIFGMETFEVHLKGRHFKLFTDHKPLEKLGKVHTKTWNRLQQMMNLFSFDIIYKQGSKMPADFLS